MHNSTIYIYIYIYIHRKIVLDGMVKYVNLKRKSKPSQLVYDNLLIKHSRTVQVFDISFNN